MLDKKILKRLIKRKKNEFLKEFSLSFIFFIILALSYFPNTIYPATPNTQQHHKMKSNPNTVCIAKKIPQYESEDSFSWRKQTIWSSIEYDKERDINASLLQQLSMVYPDCPPCDYCCIFFWVAFSFLAKRVSTNFRYFWWTQILTFDSCSYKSAWLVAVNTYFLGFLYFFSFK